MALTRQQAKQIIDSVANDPTSVHRIDSGFKILPMGIAGDIRNRLFSVISDNTEPGSLANTTDCNAIAKASALAITTKASRDISFPVKIAVDERRLDTETEHQATYITMKDGSIYVFDWHSFLDVNNPVIYASPLDFTKGIGVRFSIFKGF